MHPLRSGNTVTDISSENTNGQKGRINMDSLWGYVPFQTGRFCLLSAPCINNILTLASAWAWSIISLIIYATVIVWNPDCLTWSDRIIKNPPRLCTSFVFCCVLLRFAANGFVHIIKDYFTDTEIAIRLPQSQWNNFDWQVFFFKNIIKDNISTKTYAHSLWWK